MNRPRHLLRILPRRTYATLYPRPLGEFYTSMLQQPLHPLPSAQKDRAPPPSPASPSPAVPPTPSERNPVNPKTPPASDAESDLIFRPRLAGANVGARDDRKGTTVAGVYIPPKPIEPDNCCMSGCVNCVLEAFIEDLASWKKAKKKAEAAQRGEKGAALQESKRKAEEVAASMDDDGGVAKEELWEGYEDVPVGLRVFMENERKIKLRKLKAAKEAEGKA